MATDINQILPQNFSIPTPPPIPKGNISSLVNPDILSNLAKSRPPKTFGDQVLNTATQQAIKAVSESTIAILYKEKEDLVKEGIQRDLEHQITLQKLEQKIVPAKQVKNGIVVDIPPKLTQEEYEKAVAIENVNYEAAKKNLQERKDKNQKDIDDYLKDPFKKQKDEIKKFKEKRRQLKNRTKTEKRKARKERANKIFKSIKNAAVPAIVPILTLVLTNKIAEIIAQNDRIKKLVNDTNAIITEANESGNPTKLNNAKLARNNAVKIIQDNENKLIKIKDQIQRIQTYISIFTVIVNIISAIPIPTSVPPGIGIPVNLIMKFVKILDKANRIIAGLSTLIPILISILGKAVDILENYKRQLLNINAQLEIAAVNQAATSNSGTSPLLEDNQDIKFGSFPTEYKGFKFAIREENNPRFNVRGNKRHYAVAIDVNNVEVLKSEASFTLDPNDLIDQLKLIIDREKLIAGAGRGGTIETTTSEEGLQDFSETSPENINSLISSSTTQIRRQQEAEKQRQKEELESTIDVRSTETTKNVIRTGEVRPPLTSQQKRYYENIVRDTNQPLYERQNAQNILKRNYI